MAVEITTDQARLLVRLRRRFPDGDVRVHERSWGVIVEVRRGDRVVALTALHPDGRIARDRPITSPAAQPSAGVA
jgi:hypothetical protein